MAVLFCWLPLIIFLLLLNVSHNVLYMLQLCYIKNTELLLGKMQGLALRNLYSHLLSNSDITLFLMNCHFAPDKMKLILSLSPFQKKVNMYPCKQNLLKRHEEPKNKKTHTFLQISICSSDYIKPPICIEEINLISFEI